MCKPRLYGGETSCVRELCRHSACHYNHVSLIEGGQVTVEYNVYNEAVLVIRLHKPVAERHVPREKACSVTGDDRQPC
jgi:hypothetical protein